MNVAKERLHASAIRAFRSRTSILRKYRLRSEHLKVSPFDEDATAYFSDFGLSPLNEY
jgi:hypothetical protein